MGGGRRGDGVTGPFSWWSCPAPGRRGRGREEGRGGEGRGGEVKGEEEGFLRRCERPAEVTNVFSVHECFFRLHCWAGTGRGATRTQFRATRVQFPATRMQFENPCVGVLDTYGFFFDACFFGCKL